MSIEKAGAMADEEVKVVQLRRSELCGFGFSVVGGLGSDLPPVIYDIIEDSPAACSGKVSFKVSKYIVW